MRQPGRRPYQHTRRVGGCGAPGGPGADRAQASPSPSASPSPATSRSGVALALRTLFLRQGCWPLRGWVRKRGVPPAPPTTPGEWQTPARPRCPARRSAPPIRGTLARRPSPGRLRAGYHLEAAARHRHAPPIAHVDPRATGQDPGAFGGQALSEGDPAGSPGGQSPPRARKRTGACRQLAPSTVDSSGDDASRPEGALPSTRQVDQGLVRYPHHGAAADPDQERGIRNLGVGLAGELPYGAVGRRQLTVPRGEVCPGPQPDGR